ncbi:galactose-1-phosphate uridylyltransferase [Sandaracinus amylolyticus]|uniref:Galactose-1-phosphate uridylyltransferase n=1 Tax=Sandaracinus amylolyticus TaxID=927083 RepID=A0A0F6SDQ2_9BACT|nr:galactose-1-phosphate uridylyltransferase [Sandaracinus amylolyticus]AKF03839.1 Galactose-1-phosphate uridylyltransferase [Sandaracinus amylolyticus]
MTRVMHKRSVSKPDGRAMHLYAHAPVTIEGDVPVPPGAAPTPSPHLRWHPLRGEWVAYAGHRQHRTFLPPPEWDPLAPTVDPDAPTEVPRGTWEIAVFENRFPTLFGGSHERPELIVETAPGRGACEVVVYQQEATGSLGALPLPRIEMLIDVWADRTAELGARDDVAYVFPFENRGVEVGVTLHHPHGQIYAYPFVPPSAARELEQQRAYLHERGRGLLERMIERELVDGRRVLYDGEGAVAFVPACARWAYEVWVAPRRPAPRFDDLERAERRDLARALKTVLLKLDGLWSAPMPYMLVFHQAPSDGALHPEAHLHAEIYPALRLPGRLKYLAGSEIGAGVFTADTFPEEKAAELRAIEVRLA